MKAFVTGGTGFIGSHLVEALLARNHDVACLVRTPAKAASLFPSHPQLTLVPGDLDDLDAMGRGADGADVVYHIAGLIAARNKDEFNRVNAHATRTLTKVVARRAPNLERFVYVSSLAAAGPSRRGAPLTADSSTHPVSNYGWSKRAGEEAVQTSDLPWTIIRPAMVYGPRDREVFKLFRIAKLGFAVFFGDGSQELSFVYAPDLAEALIETIVPATRRGTYFACHPEIRSARAFSSEIYRTVKQRPDGAPRVLGVPPVAARAVLWVTGTTAALARRPTLLSADKANEFLADAWTCTPDALANATGWTASTDTAAGVRKTWEWYGAAGWL